MPLNLLCLLPMKKSESANILPTGAADPTRTVGVVIRKDHSAAFELAHELKSWCDKHALKLLCGAAPGRTAIMSEVDSASLSELPSRCFLICSLGGDGTLISTARFSGPTAPLFLGVHFGTLGFLTEITPAHLFETLESALSAKPSVSARSLFSVVIQRGGEELLKTQSLNDVVIQKGAQSRLIEIDVHAGDEPVMRLRSDGLIVATPTGSTAYSMAAGGPIIEPSLAAITLTPICPHSLTSRPLVLGLNTELTISLPSTSDRVFAIIDGVETMELATGDTITVKEAPNRARFLRRKGASYFEALRRKLHWNAPNEGEA